MKRLKEKISGLQELRKPSLTIKWAFASSFFIFVVFTIFAVTTYQSSIALFVEKERKNAEQVTDEIASRLANSTNELSLVSTYRNLTNSTRGGSRLYDRTSTLEGILMKIDPFISELGRSEMTLYVYNLEEKLVFKTREKNVQLTQTTNKSPSVVTIDGLTGFILVRPIYSIETGEKTGYAQTFYELTSFYAIRNRLLIILIVLEIISFIVSSVLGYLLSSYYLKPLKVLRDTMEQIQKNPQADIHTPKIDTNDELADMAEIFNRMLDRMRSYTEQQEQFVEDVSHELRTPVAIIEGHLNMLNRWGKNDPEILEESLDASMQEISRMKTLVQEMLDLSRAEQVDVYYSNETTQAKEVVHQVFNNFKMLYPDFVFILDDDLASEKLLQIYRNHFEQILIILLDNAVKYSTDRKEVHLSLSKNSKEVEIVIQDFGEGISEGDISKIFHRFYRVDKARARTKGGNGLGLSIAKQLLESYKGKIMVQSSLGQGTIFRMYIPIVKEALELQK
ncbi:HAMP domain-containing sensor histidine kinase [Enterococcus olivae]